MATEIARSRSNSFYAGAYASPYLPSYDEDEQGDPQSQTGNPVNDVYLPQLREIGSQLQSAYAAPHPGMARQIIGAFLSRRNPELGGLISGETQRQRTIEPLMQQYGLLSNIIQQNRASQLANLNVAKTQADIDYMQKHGQYFDTIANAKENPADKMIDKGFDANGNALGVFQRSDNTLYTQPIPGIVNPQTLKPPTAKDADIQDYLEANKLDDTAVNREKARVAIANRTKRPVDQEMADINKQLKKAQLEKSLEPTADEQRRADLAENMNENLDQLEDILSRRPDLFGPVAGRVTWARNAIGTSDPDVAKLKAIKEYFGMASVGAHAMRNAQHVATAADAVINGFTNSPDAMRAAIEAARNSTATFMNDAQRRRNAVLGTKPGDRLGILQ